ncbi:unnamed protein product [Pleuronectes platessa]|uniref:Uncharacterized protein n=1 Tax=Pleuronectes platessa TaxID=8262 RepID=A0A9N7TPA5_PLEPL|nr:unnamed protein product [Pleuronectes platessa]
MRINTKNMDPIAIGDQTLEEVDKFTYLGNVIAVDARANESCGHGRYLDIQKSLKAPCYVTEEGGAMRRGAWESDVLRVVATRCYYCRELRGVYISAGLIKSRATCWELGTMWSL